MNALDSFDNNQRILISFSARTKVYGCIVSRSDYLERIDGGSYKQDEFEANPRKYKSTFHETVRLPHFKFTDLFVKLRKNVGISNF